MPLDRPVILFPGTAIVLPENENKGEVIEVADGTRLRVGDIILFHSEPCIEVEIGDVTHRVVTECNILGWYYRPPTPDKLPPTE